MDSTKLFQTRQTIDDTHLYSNPLDQSMRSGPSFQQSRLLLPSPLMPAPQRMAPITLTPQLRVPSTPAAQSRSFFPVARAPRAADDTVIYCPVCRRDFLNSQIERHAAMHDSAASYGFRVEQPDKSLERTRETIQSQKPEPECFQYPMVEPLEFWTNELNASAKQDIFKYVRNVNYDRVDRRLFVKPQMTSSQVQTNRKPPLQYESNDTNLYNCLDNAVNSRLGPKFTFADVIGHNQIVTPKRDLDEWEKFIQYDYTNVKTIKARPFSNFR